jgi:hypothetical protein
MVAETATSVWCWGDGPAHCHDLTGPLLLLLLLLPLQIRKLFNLSKEDDVRKYVNTYRRTFEKNGKKHSKAPKIQRLVTPETLQRKRRKASIKKAKHEKARAEAADYHKLLVQVGAT